jgi:hypothetical protein
LQPGHMAMTGIPALRQVSTTVAARFSHWCLVLSAAPAC